MPSPFPGMDPYLEHPEIWPGVHLLLISALAESLTPVLRPNYAISVEVRLYETLGDSTLLVGIPDASVQRTRGQTSTTAVATQPYKPVSVTLPMAETVRQGYLEVREVTTKEVVTVIEILSPVNKRPGRGRDAYLSKRERILTTITHLVEIDLLRAWAPMPMFANGLSSHYQVLVSRSRQRPHADLYAFNLSDPIPAFPLPLDADQPEPAVDLKAVLNQVYDRNAYDLKLDYGAEPVPALTKAEAEWASTLLKKQHLR
ncbi:MAG: DUF4058 family protein [Cyanobacteria bacterium P01_F01_bin.4]